MGSEPSLCFQKRSTFRRRLVRELWPRKQLKSLVSITTIVAALQQLKKIYITMKRSEARGTKWKKGDGVKYIEANR